MTEPLMVITAFKGAYGFLSNFYPAKIVTDWDPEPIYPTAEHAFQAQKTWNLRERRIIAGAGSPGEARRLGRSVSLQGSWEQTRKRIMLETLLRKFTQNPELRQWLIATGDTELQEGNTWGDRYWGMVDGQGENWLGRLLMMVREVLG